MKRIQHSVSKNNGFTLLEVMIAVVIFSIGLLGLAALQTASLKFNHSAYQRSQATYLAYDILDRMRVNPDAAKANSYDTAFGQNPSAFSCNGTGANCSTGDLAAADLYEWKQALQTILPSGDGEITRAVSGTKTVFTIKVRWRDVAQDIEDAVNPQTALITIDIKGEV